MPDEVKDAVIAAMKDPQIGAAIDAGVQKALQEKLQTSLPEVVSAAVKATLRGKAKADEDPYRTTFHFLGGLLAFCLAVIVGIFNALPDPPLDPADGVIRMFGGVLAWIAITALVATACAAIAQALKYAHLQKGTAAPGVWLPALLMAAPAVFGAVAVAYCVRGGAALLNGDSGLIGLADAFCRLLPF
jgi:hypothetical protein